MPKQFFAWSVLCNGQNNLSFHISKVFHEVNIFSWRESFDDIFHTITDTKACWGPWNEKWHNEKNEAKRLTFLEARIKSISYCPFFLLICQYGIKYSQHVGGINICPSLIGSFHSHTSLIRFSSTGSSRNSEAGALYFAYAEAAFANFPTTGVNPHIHFRQLPPNIRIRASVTGLRGINLIHIMLNLICSMKAISEGWRTKLFGNV